MQIHKNVYHNIKHTDAGKLLPLGNRIGGVMVSVLASCAVDHGFEPRSGQTKD